jgi:hypothetical protein
MSIILLASRPQQSTNNEDLPGQYYLLKEYFRVIIILQKRAAGSNCPFQNQIATTQRYF